jgi:methanol:N,N-dimethyl-4-nitrosoaniline oxidoreductase
MSITHNIQQYPIKYGNTSRLGKVAFGWGAHTTVADECKACGIKNALITTTGLKGSGIVDEIKGILNYHGISTQIYDKVTSNPKDHEVEAAYKIFKDAQCDGVVSVGGGSSHDTGKGVRAMAANPGKYVCDMVAVINPPWMQEVKKYKPVALPQVCVTTTSGTGAELSGGAAIINTKVRAKFLVMVPGQASYTGIIDPLLVRTQPKNIAAWSGFDAFAHAFEVYVNRIQTEYSTALCLRAIQLIAQNLREFAFNRMNHTACENMCWAESMAGGVGLSYGGSVGIVHGIGHGISVLGGAHHGLANAVITLPMERYNQPMCPDKFADMARAMGVDTRNMTRMEASDAWFNEVERLLKDLDVETGNLKKQFGLTKADCAHIVKVQYSNDFPVQGNPRDYNYEECVALLESLL